MLKDEIEKQFNFKKEPKTKKNNNKRKMTKIDVKK
jgi:hypothetical protein